MRRGLWLGSLLVLAAGSAPIVEMPGPARGPTPRQAERLELNDACLACHEDHGDDWQRSLHRMAYEDPMFQAALGRERDPGFCRSCHAPEAEPKRPPSAAAAAVGVACVTCHVSGRDAAVLAAARPGAVGYEAATRRRPHGLHRSEAFATAEACAGCHEFWFPGSARSGHRLKMQRTISEHARSAFADRSCQSCHMPTLGRGEARHEHRFAVAGQVQLLRRAVEVEATREGDRVVLELRPGEVGHAVPTGDLFRRLSVELVSDDDGPGWSAAQVLGRRFANQRVAEGPAIRVEQADTRVGVGSRPTIVEFELPPELRRRALRWRLVHERALDAPVGPDWQADLWDRTAFAEGRLPSQR